MQAYFFILVVIGLAALGMAWMPSITRHLKVSYSIIYVVLGMIVFSLFPSLPWPDPVANNDMALKLTELVVIISLMGTGLKIDEKFGFKTWNIPFRLVTLTMLICIALMTFLGVELLDLPLASALVMAAALAPTDPVLASDVQVGPPLENEKNNIRFSLTAEAGLNDGMAFPFTWLAILLLTGDYTLGHWISYYLVFKILVGAVIGYLMGRLVGYLIFELPQKTKILATRDGLVALSVTLLVYGLTELAGGYGFIAVFITAITLRNKEMNHKYHLKLHAFIDEIERILLAIVLLLFGGSIVNGVLDHLNWMGVLVAVLFLFIIRPLAAMITLIKAPLNFKEKIAISFFGIKGIGSLFYLAFAFSVTEGFAKNEIWSIVAFIVLLSVIIHGLSATSAMEKLESPDNDKSQFTKPDEQEVRE